MGYQLAQVTQTRGIFTAVYFRLAKEHERWKRSLEESLHVKERKIEELQQQKESYISQVGRPREPQYDLLSPQHDSVFVVLKGSMLEPGTILHEKPQSTIRLGSVIW